jgi:hypothetical protein
MLITRPRSRGGSSSGIVRRGWLTPTACAVLLAGVAVLAGQPGGTALAQAGATITVNTTAETAIFTPAAGAGDVPSYSSSVTGDTMPGYSGGPATVVAGGTLVTPLPSGTSSGICSLREAIYAASQDVQVNGCVAGIPGTVTTIKIPAGTYVIDSHFYVGAPIDFVGADAGIPGNSPARGPETILKLEYNNNWQAQAGLMWLNHLGSPGKAGGGSTFDGIDFQGTDQPACGVGSTSAVPCESHAIIAPDSPSTGAIGPGFTAKDDIFENWTSALYIGGQGTVVTDNLFRDDDKFLNYTGAASQGDDIYSDEVYQTADTTITDNVFANPATAAIDFESAENGVTIKGNVIDNFESESVPGTGAIFMFGVKNVMIEDNVLTDTRNAGSTLNNSGIRVANDQGVTDSGNTITGYLYGLNFNDFGLPQGPTTGVVETNNRLYGNEYGLRMNQSTSFAPGTVVANDNWWGANGGPDSTGARPGAPQPVNGVLIVNLTGVGHPHRTALTALITQLDPDPSRAALPPGGPVTLTTWLHLTCTLGTTTLTTGTSTSVTGSVTGMPSVHQPLFTSIAEPVMDASVSGGIGTVTGFGKVPSNGYANGAPLSGATLTGTFHATHPGTGAVNVALDSEQVPCSVTGKAVPAAAHVRVSVLPPVPVTG